MLALKSFLAALGLVVLLGIAFAVLTPKGISAALDTTDGRAVARSLADAGRTMNVELPQDCLDAIAQHVAAFGYAQGAVTDKGAVLIRDLHGVDVWVCD